MKSNFNTSKWFKNQYLYEGMSDEEIHAIKRYEELTDDDKLKLAKIQKMMDRERALREEIDINKILSDGGYDIIDDEELLMTVKSRLKGKNNIDAEKLNLLVMKIEDEEGGNIDFNESNINEMDAPMHIEKLMDAAEMAYDAGMDVDEILGMIEQHLGLKMGDY